MSTEIPQLSYAQLLKSMMDFKKSGKKSGEEFNYLDTPGHKYFKILFYFGDTAFNSSNEGYKSNGLLHPSWYVGENKDNIELDEINTRYNFNSAWSFLKFNDENERADKLKKFINLLSNINSYSPWYFTSISGLDSAMERTGPDSGKMDFGEELKKITITCLPDAFDNRITTLLELYRDITWSWSQKRQILPSNLKKFDMAIYIFESPVRFWHDVGTEYTTFDGSNTHYNPSYKLLEFHDCEFSYNSIKSGWGELNNQTGFNPTYSIEISYNDCYEVSYNEHIMRTIGDVIKTDTYQAVIRDNINVSNNSVESIAQEDNNEQLNEVDERVEGVYNFQNYSLDKIFPDADKVYSWGNLEMRDNYTKHSNYEKVDYNGNPISPRKLNENVVYEEDVQNGSGFLGNVIEQGVGYVTDTVKETITSAILGNLYNFSLTKVGSQLDDLAKGNLIKTSQAVQDYVENEQNNSSNNNKSALGNIFDNTPNNNQFKGQGNFFGNLGNKLSPSSIANN